MGKYVVTNFTVKKVPDTAKRNAGSEYVRIECINPMNIYARKNPIVFAWNANAVAMFKEALTESNGNVKQAIAKMGNTATIIGNYEEYIPKSPFYLHSIDANGNLTNNFVTDSSGRPKIYNSVSVFVQKYWDDETNSFLPVNGENVTTLGTNLISRMGEFINPGNSDEDLPPMNGLS